MLQFQLLLLITIVFLPRESVVAFPLLSPRQFDDNWGDIDWDKIGAGFAGAGAAIGTYLNLQPSGQQDTTTTTIPEEAPGTALPDSFVSEPNYGLAQPPEKPKEPTLVPSLPPPQCDMANIFNADCGKILIQLIFTTGCANIAKGQVPTAIANAQNGAILAELNKMAPGQVQTSTSSLCGVFMFKAPLTAEQGRQIAGTPGVSHVSSDILFEPSDGSVNNPQPLGVTEPAFKRRRLRKRAIVRQREAPAHLSFLSTPENYPGISDDYIYDSRGGVDTEVFHVGPGVAMNHREFAKNRITPADFIFADDIGPNDTLLAGSDGTCAASLVMGDVYGVSKYTKLRPVRTDNSVSSLITAMIKIADYVGDRDGTGQPGNGFVMLLNMAWINTDRVSSMGFELLLRVLVNDYDVVTVVAAHYARDGSYPPIETYPSIYARYSPVISVGAVDLRGERFSGSPSGSVTAPGSALCASNEGATITGRGTPMAASQTAGLAAYLLALHPELRAGQKMKEFIVTNAWARLPGGDKTIWNLMGPEMPDSSGNNILPMSPY